MKPILCAVLAVALAVIAAGPAVGQNLLDRVKQLEDLTARRDAKVASLSQQVSVLSAEVAALRAAGGATSTSVRGPSTSTVAPPSCSTSCTCGCVLTGVCTCAGPLVRRTVASPVSYSPPLATTWAAPSYSAPTYAPAYSAPTYAPAFRSFGSGFGSCGPGGCR